MYIIYSYYLIIYTTLYIDQVFSEREDHSYWQNLGESDIKRALETENIAGIAKNVILFIGDGMGLTTITAARIYGKTEKGYLTFEEFPHIGSLKTYNADKLVPDSCSTATALFCGVKANHKTAGVDSSVKLDDCEASLNAAARLSSIVGWAQKAGKATGFVTTTRVTHATPSALYAHTPNRKWECESTMPENAKKCKDIARQLIEDEPGKNINVIMGGGRQGLQSDVTGSGADPVDTWSCYSKDGRDLIKDWTLDKEGRFKKHAVVTNNEELSSLDTNSEFVLGIFANGHLKMDYTRDRSSKGMPSLSNMTKKAIEVLSRNDKGYLLVVEGGLIDFAHHRGHARQALDETIAFSDAVAEALKIVDVKNTLITVTSDHSHSLVFSGYVGRNDNILNATDKSKIDSTPYTALLYGTGGPNNYQFEIKQNSVSRVDPSLNNTLDFEYSQQAAILTDEVTHGGSDVLVYAKGPYAHLFHSVHEQTYVAYVISYAAKIGPFENTNYATNLQLSLHLLLTSVISLYILC